ncbi:ATP-binding cassette domain-containing protein [Citricoccus sp. SGAir0253]|uniref:ABC transporter ATP-binding protein n=1 Tax=Citricoccus sp. SGAir0253 TaxID=2567881 RepID=UPI0010CCFDF4|nr:ATP-binding cassette domain-containing protein [Citricoccus sp. SGAir0253]QCU78739.1 ATP-binding cassette domain-containing protein [Citricoccus sp. SGAir0253]
MISYRSVTKRFPDGTVAVDDFSLEVPRGSLTVLAGSSGCGKTTLMRMVNRMVDPSSGQVLVDGTDIAGRDPVALRRRIGYVMQNSGLLPHRTVAQNIATVPRLTGMDRRAARRRALEMMELVGLDPRMADRYPAQLSGGQQQRVGVARGLAADPEILLMDEPFGAVDPLVRAELQRQLVQLHRQIGTTILFVTHDMDEALALGDEIVLLQSGARIAQRGTPRQFVAEPASDFVRTFLGLDRGQRVLHRERTGDGSVVLVDAHGRPAGVLAEPDPRPDGGPHPGAPADVGTGPGAQEGPAA